MEEKTQVIYHGEQVIDRPPPYSSESTPSSSGAPPFGPHAYTTGVIINPSTGVGTNVGIVGTNVGVVGTNIGVVGVGQTTAVPIFIGQQIGPKPSRITCKSCNNEITTRVESKPTWKTHFFAGLLCLMGCWCCCCAPYCIDSCSNSDHYCPNCNAYVASYVT